MQSLETAKHRTMGFSLLELLIVIAMLTSIAASCLPLLQKAKQADLRTQSSDNLKKIGLAFHGFRDAHKRLPFNGSDVAVESKKYSRTAIANTSNSGSWGFQVLPFIDHDGVFKQLDRKAGISEFMCPGRGRPLIETSNGGGAWTDFFYNNYLNDAMHAAKPDNPDARRSVVTISDGASYTILVGHGSINTKEYKLAADVTLSTNIFLGGTTGTMRSGDNTTKAKPGNPGGVILQRDADERPVIGSWGGPFKEGGLMAMGDGTVHLFPYKTKNFSAFLTPDGDDEAILPNP